MRITTIGDKLGLFRVHDALYGVSIIDSPINIFTISFIKLLQYINLAMTSTELAGAKCYAIRRNQGFKVLMDKHILNLSKAKVEDAISKNKIGELNVNRNFLKKGLRDMGIKKTNSTQCRAVIFRRSLV